MLVRISDETVDKIISDLLKTHYEYAVKESRNGFREQDRVYYGKLRGALRTVMAYFMMREDYEEVFGEGSYSED